MGSTSRAAAPSLLLERRRKQPNSKKISSDTPATQYPRPGRLILVMGPSFGSFEGLLRAPKDNASAWTFSDRQAACVAGTQTSRQGTQRFLLKAHPCSPWVARTLNLNVPEGVRKPGPKGWVADNSKESPRTSLRGWCSAFVRRQQKQEQPARRIECVVGVLRFLSNHWSI